MSTGNLDQFLDQLYTAAGEPTNDEFMTSLAKTAVRVSTSNGLDRAQARTKESRKGHPKRGKYERRHPPLGGRL